MYSTTNRIAADDEPSQVGYLFQFPYMTTHQQDSSQPQQSQASPHLMGLGLTMEVMEEAALAGMLNEVSDLRL